MKKIIINKITFILFTALVVSSCDKKIDEAYQNPNADTRVPVESLLPGIIANMWAGSGGHGAANDGRFIGRYIQNWQLSSSGDLYDEMGGTTGASDNAGSIWRSNYYDLGQNVQQLIKWGSEEKKWDYVGVAYAIEAWSWLQLTDYHGEVIFKEAFNSQLTFKYDLQEDVYAGVRALCFTALDYLSKTGDAVSQANLAIGDQYGYNGDVNKWKKFVYAVLARSYNHLSNKSIYKPDSVIFYCDKSIITNADNLTVKFANTGISGNANFYGPYRGNIGTLRQAAYSVKLLTGNNSALSGINDPRAWYFFRPNSNGTLVGLPPNKGNAAITPATDRPENFWGVSNATSTNNTAPTNDNNCKFIFRNGVEVPVITASEVLFMKAEAAFKKGDRATALAAYTSAISLHFDLLSTTYSANIPSGKEITPINKAAYLAAVTPATPSALRITQIMMQKYIALWGYGTLESWVDMRRYHYTDLDPETSQQVYADFTIPTGSDLWVDNAGKPVYRVRPRYNSEYVWNLNELIRIGADKLDYHTKECWFSQK